MAKKKKKNADNPDGLDPQDASVSFGRTEDLGDTAAFTEALEPIVGPDPVAADDDLEELDDVLVLLPDEDDPVSQDSVAFFATESMGGPEATEAAGFVPAGAPTDVVGMTEGMTGGNSYGVIPGSGEATSSMPNIDGPTRVEDVGLLAQHPDHGVLPVEPGYVEEEVGELPDIEDVEDITSLVEEAVASEMAAPQNDFDDEFAEAYDSEPSGSVFATLMKLAAVVAIVGAGVFYGPDLYEQYVVQTQNPVVAKTDPASGGTNGTVATTTDPAVDPKTSTDPNPVTDASADGGTPTTTDTTVATNASREELSNWMAGVVATNFWVSTPDGR